VTDRSSPSGLRSAGLQVAGVGHGKLVLCGEHAVVHGHPAIAFAVELSTTVRLTARPGFTRIHSPHADQRLAEALSRVVQDEGLEIEIETDLPVGRGMGSSAALAVALVRARAVLEGDPLDPDRVYERAMPIERAFHGNPSGVDVAVSARGGCLWFRRGNPAESSASRPADFGSQPLREPLAPGRWSIVVLDSGTAGDTAALVAQVSARRPEIDPLLDRIGTLVHEARSVLLDPPALGALLTENHRLLAQIGVSTPALDELVELALGAGAYGAKLAGAGGGGVVLALCPDTGPVLRAARAKGISAFETGPWTP
jgi:mevalonate kinase